MPLTGMFNLSPGKSSRSRIDAALSARLGERFSGGLGFFEGKCEPELIGALLSN
jgi:hypothetical protein